MEQNLNISLRVPYNASQLKEKRLGHWLETFPIVIYNRKDLKESIVCHLEYLSHKKCGDSPLAFYDRIFHEMKIILIKIIFAIVL